MLSALADQHMLARRSRDGGVYGRIKATIIRAQMIIYDYRSCLRGYDIVIPYEETSLSYPPLTDSTIFVFLFFLEKILTLSGNYIKIIRYFVIKKLRRAK